MILYLIRHGRSIANEEKLVTGNTKDTLSQAGIRQVEELKNWLLEAGIQPDHYITSQWVRAQQTAKILWPDIEWEINPKIGETNAGRVTEWKLSDYLQQYPDFYTSSSNSYPGGESHDELNIRSISWLKQLLNRSGCEDRVMLVAHSGPISCLLQYVTKVSMEKFPAFLPSNASLSIVDFPDNSVVNAEITGFSLGSINT